jgi:cell wall-associated NlpC family hydrolase
LLSAAIAVASIVGCRSAPVPPPREMPPPGAVSPAESDSGPAPGRVGRDRAVAGLVAAARSVLGAPYRYGGVDRRGFDCSGLTAYAFAAAGVSLPRTAADQARAGRWVALDELRAGDLVFFSIASKPNHVGLVVSRGGAPLRMIHASNSHGVVETEVLRDRYWLDRLRFGRRVLPGGSP